MLTFSLIAIEFLISQCSWLTSMLVKHLQSHPLIFHLVAQFEKSQPVDLFCIDDFMISAETVYFLSLPSMTTAYDLPVPYSTPKSKLSHFVLVHLERKVVCNRHLL